MMNDNEVKRSESARTLSGSAEVLQMSTEEIRQLPQVLDGVNIIEDQNDDNKSDGTLKIKHQTCAKGKIFYFNGLIGLRSMSVMCLSTHIHANTYQLKAS